MQAVYRVIKPLQRALQAFFSHDISLRRNGKKLTIVMEGKTAADGQRPKSPADEAARRDRDELSLMLRQLTALLSEQPQTRTRLRHLVFVEHALQKKGLRALHKLPLDVLQQALEQLEALVSNWSSEGLANLRSKMAVVIIDREYMDPQAEADAYNTSMPLETPEPVLPASAATAGDDESADNSGNYRAENSVNYRADNSGDNSADDRALAAAYAALGAASPASSASSASSAAQVEMQGELASPSAKAVIRAAGRVYGALPEIKLRELER